MTVQEYGIKFNQLSRYAPHMVATSMAQINKFLYGLSDLVKTDCNNVMLLLLNRLRVISLVNMLRKLRRLGLGTMTIFSIN